MDPSFPSKNNTKICIRRSRSLLEGGHFVGSLAHILPNTRGLMIQGLSRVDQQNPKALAYQYSIKELLTP
jgi:hypothetical protein